MASRSWWWCRDLSSLLHIQVDITCTGQVNWQQLCSFLFLEYTERERASIPTAALLDRQPQIRHCSHNKVGLPTVLVNQDVKMHLCRMLQCWNNYTESSMVVFSRQNTHFLSDYSLGMEMQSSWNSFFPSCNTQLFNFFSILFFCIFLIILTAVQREPTVRVVAVSHPPSLHYISVSKGGQITVWNSSLHILKTLAVSDISVLLLHARGNTTHSLFILPSLLETQRRKWLTQGGSEVGRLMLCIWATSTRLL